MNGSVQLTILNSMAGTDFEQALDQHVWWGLRVLDLKDAIFGKSVDDLTPQEAEQAARLIAARNLTVETLSTGIYYSDIEQGETTFRAKFSTKLNRILETAPILQPSNVRLLSATSSKRSTFANAADYISDQQPWVFSLYRETIERLYEAGFQVVIELEDASWPVTDLVNAVIRDGGSPVICVNGSHGAKNLAYRHTMDDCPPTPIKA